MKTEGCPICGYEAITAFDEHGCPTFEICDSCGCEAGNEYDSNSSVEHLNSIRRIWIDDKNCKWWGSSTPPENWDPIEQMKQARIKF